MFMQMKDLKNKIYKNVRCIVCQGQSIYDSDTDFAIDLKKINLKETRKWRKRKADLRIFNKSIRRMDCL